MIESGRNLLISLIIPAYNVESYIDECFDSLRRQSYQCWEAVVVDDGSTDRTPTICDEWAEKDSRIKVIHRRNSGVSESRNAAMENISGDIVGFIDADDFLADNALEIISAEFSDSTADAVFTGHKRVDEEGNEVELRKGVNMSGCSREQAVYSTLKAGKESSLGVLWNKFFKREFIYKSGKIIRFNSEYKVGEDQIWLLQALENTKKINFIEEPVYCYRIRSGSAVHAEEWTAAKESELPARQELMRIVSELYPNLTYAAAEKYRRCLKGLYKLASHTKNKAAIGLVSRYGKKGYFDVIKSDKISTSCKVKETVWQGVFIISSLFFHSK